MLRYSSRTAFSCEFVLPFLVGLLALSAAVPLDAAVRVALLQTNPAQTSDVVALVEADLTTAGKVTLVERQQVEKVLHEQQVQAVLGADAIAGRTLFGKLLQADLLVFIRPQDKPQPNWELIVAETHQGLRLIRQPIAIQDSRAAAGAIERLIAEALDKQSQKTQVIFAVPPFVSNDLGFSFDYLRGAYAQVVEGALARQKGVVVVELAEARALAKEILLTSGADVTRPLPLYVMGEYRTTGRAASRKVELDLKLMRGEKEIAGGTKENLTLEQAPVFLQQVAMWFMSKSDAGPHGVTDPKVETAQLAERAHLLLSVGGWQESLDVAEASLLLDPNQAAVHRDALSALSGLLGPDPWGRGADLPPGLPSRGNSTNKLIRRALEHLEPYLRQATVHRAQDERLLEAFLIRMSGARRITPGWRSRLTDEERDGVEVGGLAEEMFVRVLEDKCRRQVVDDTALFLPEFEAKGDLSDDQMRELNFKLLSELTFMPREGAIFETLIDQQHPLDPANLEFDRKVRRLANTDLQRSVDQWMKTVEAIRLANSKKPSPPQESPQPQVTASIKPEAKPAKGGDARLIRLTLKSDGTAGDNAWLPVEGWLPAGKGVDVVWSANGIFVMKQKGIIRQIDDRAPKSSQKWQFAQPAFDGKYVWFTRETLLGRRGYHLLAVDPQTEKVLEIDSDAGLPHSDSLLVAPISPGRAVVVGSFGQTYVATVTLIPESKPTHGKVEMLHEFRRVPVSGDNQQWRNADLIFTPWSMQVVNEKRADGSLHQAALVWRQSAESAVGAHLISIDLTTGAAHALEQETYTQSPCLIAASGGDCWEIGSDPHIGWEMSRIGYSSVTTRSIGLEPDSRARTQLIEYDGALHLMNDRGGWSIGALDKGPFRKIKIAVPENMVGLTLQRSQFYGLVGWIYRPENLVFNPTHLDPTLYRIEFARPVRELIDGGKAS